MKKNITYVAQDKVETIIAKHPGLTVTTQAGFVKLSAAAGRNLYVARTKGVGRIDVSGFLFEDPGVRTLGEGERFGKVHQQFDFTRTEDEILASLDACLGHMLTLPAAEKVKRESPMAAPGGARQKRPSPTEGMTDVEAAAHRKAARAARKELILKVAKEKGAPVSEAVLAADEPTEE